jgi:hypothetical protein
MKIQDRKHKEVWGNEEKRAAVEFMAFCYTVLTMFAVYLTSIEGLQATLNFNLSLAAGMLLGVLFRVLWLRQDANE